MPNPYHYRSAINRLTRLTGPSHPGYIRLRAVTALLRELSPANPRAAANNRMLQAVDSYDLARHQLRDLYDHADPAKTSESSFPPPLPLGEGWGEGPHSPTEDPTDEESPEEDDDPL